MGHQSINQSAFQPIHHPSIHLLYPIQSTFNHPNPAGFRTLLPTNHPWARSNLTTRLHTFCIHTQSVPVTVRYRPAVPYNLRAFALKSAPHRRASPRPLQSGILRQATEHATLKAHEPHLTTPHIASLPSRCRLIRVSFHSSSPTSPEIPTYSVLRINETSTRQFGRCFGHIEARLPSAACRHSPTNNSSTTLTLVLSLRLILLGQSLATFACLPCISNQKIDDVPPPSCRCGPQ